MLAFLGNFLSGGAVGLLTATLPAIIHYFQSRQDNAHELAMRQLELQAASQAAAQHLQEIDATGQWQEVVNLIKAQAKPSGIAWIDGLSSFIRPFLTLYWCVGVFTGVKVVQMYVLLHSDTPWQTLSNVVLTVWWGAFEQELIGAMFMYWFGSRGFAKWRAGKA